MSKGDAELAALVAAVDGDDQLQLELGHVVGKFRRRREREINARETKRYHHRLRSGPYIAVTPEERERQAEIARLCGELRAWGTVSWDGRFKPLRPMVRVELEAA
jgi:hypothetical protein